MHGDGGDDVDTRRHLRCERIDEGDDENNESDDDPARPPVLPRYKLCSPPPGSLDIVHGSTRNADDYLCAGHSAASMMMRDTATATAATAAGDVDVVA